MVIDKCIQRHTFRLSDLVRSWDAFCSLPVGMSSLSYLILLLISAFLVTDFLLKLSDIITWDKRERQTNQVHWHLNKLRKAVRKKVPILGHFGNGVMKGNDVPLTYLEWITIHVWDFSRYMKFFTYSLFNSFISNHCFHFISE